MQKIKTEKNKNENSKVIDDFGEEWKSYNYSSFDELKLLKNLQKTLTT